MKKEEKTVGWKFPPNYGGEIAGVNNSAIDAFAGKRLPSVVREVIQNSLDARKDDKEPVRICFRYDEVDKDVFDGFAGIKPHLQACKEMMERQGLSVEASVYEKALKEVDQPHVAILSVHDYNTKGLEGDLDEAFGSWVALVKGAGMSQKSATGALGSYGHGSKAPFTMSNIRSIFYLSRIQPEGDDFENRFQGKSILQTHNDPDEPEIQTQGTGFYGHKKGCSPLLDGEIPDWAMQLRGEVTEETGTSIFIPYTSFTKNLEAAMIITVIANFFYAVHSGALEVVVGDECINQETLPKKFEACKNILESQKDEVDVSHVKDCFVSIDTILNYDYHNTQQITGFGLIEWFLRVHDDLAKRIGLVRSTGMLITRRPPYLQRFGDTKPFDMFVCVKGDDGSDFLKQLENPTHDNFEFDRVEEGGRRKAEQKYQQFSNRIREIILRYAKLDDDTEEDANELAGLFSDISEVAGDSKGRIERGKKFLIKNGPSKPPSTPRLPGLDEQPTEQGDTWGEGQKGGEGQTEGEGGDNETAEGSAAIEGETSGQGTLSNARYVVRNFRVNHFDVENRKAKLYFDPPFEGKGLLSVSVVGEHGSDPVHFIDGQGESVPCIEIEVPKSGRCAVEVMFETAAHQMALEANVVEKAEEASEAKKGQTVEA